MPSTCNGKQVTVLCMYIHTHVLCMSNAKLSLILKIIHAYCFDICIWYDALIRTMVSKATVESSASSYSKNNKVLFKPMLATFMIIHCSSGLCKCKSVKVCLEEAFVCIWPCKCRLGFILVMGGYKPHIRSLGDPAFSCRPCLLVGICVCRLLGLWWMKRIRNPLHSICRVCI